MESIVDEYLEGKKMEKEKQWEEMTGEEKFEAVLSGIGEVGKFLLNLGWMCLLLAFIWYVSIPLLRHMLF